MLVIPMGGKWLQTLWCLGHFRARGLHVFPAQFITITVSKKLVILSLNGPNFFSLFFMFLNTFYPILVIWVTQGWIFFSFYYTFKFGFLQPLRFDYFFDMQSTVMAKWVGYRFFWVDSENCLSGSRDLTDLYMRTCHWIGLGKHLNPWKTWSIWCDLNWNCKVTLREKTWDLEIRW